MKTAALPSQFAALRRLRDVYLELNRFDPVLYDPARCAGALAAAEQLARSELEREIARLESRLARLRAARAR